MRLLYAGTPDIAVPALRRIEEEGFSIVGVLTAPDRSAGRGRKVISPAVKCEAEKLGLATLQPEVLDREVEEKIEALQPDLLVVYAYGKIFKSSFLKLFSQGGINFHPSLLPLYRGPSPIPAAILNGERETGLTTQKISLKMDAGAILHQLSRPLTGQETTGELTEWAAAAAAEVAVPTLKRLEKGETWGIEQNEAEASYCRLIKKSDGLADWSESSEKLERMVRAYNPWPGLFTKVAGKRVRIWEASCYNSCQLSSPATVVKIDSCAGIVVGTGDGALAIRTLQKEGGKPMNFKSFLNGCSIEEGDQFG